MSLAREPERRFTYEDYLTWSGDERCELIEGVPYAMTPAPGINHQRLVLSLGRQLDIWFEGKSCEPFLSPVDVRLPSAGQPDRKAEDVLQPDVGVVCDPSKIDERGIVGAPDFVIEVLSPSTASRDQILKAGLNEKHGVREYWVVAPAERLVTIRILQSDGRFSPARFADARGRVPVAIFDGLELDFDLAYARMDATIIA